MIVFVEGTGEVNWKGVAYYNRLIDYLIKRGNVQKCLKLKSLYYV